MRLGRLFLAIGLFTGGNAVFGQEFMYVFEDTINEDNILEIQSFNYYTSNRMSNDFMDKFLFGGEITPEIKDRTYGRFGNYNAAGGEAEQSITNYVPSIAPMGREKYGMMLRFSDNHFLSANIPTGIFEYGMYGNANYTGQTKELTLAHLQYQHYQKMSVGFFDKKTMSNVTIGYVAGSKGMNARLGPSSMTTTAAGDSVNLDVSGVGFLTDRFFPYAAFLGSGFAIDMNLNFLFYSKQGVRQIVNLKINNLGMIFWNRNTRSYEVEDSLSYTGFEFNQLINNEYNFEDFSIADTVNYREEIGRVSDPLPVEIVVQKLADRGSPNKLQAIFGFKAILTADYFPYLFAGAYYQPTPNFSGSMRLSYGGFGGLQFGMRANYWIKDKVSLSLGTHNFLGMTVKNIGMGRSLNISARFKL